MPQLPWYEDGLRFQCLGCGQCCTGEPGYVWVDDAEIAALAAALNVDVDQFERSYVRRVGKKKSLVELPGGDCVFFDPPRPALFALRRPAHPMPHLALLALQRPLAGCVGRNVPRLPRKW